MVWDLRIYFETIFLHTLYYIFNYYVLKFKLII